MPEHVVANNITRATKASIKNVVNDVLFMSLVIVLTFNTNNMPFCFSCVVDMLHYFILSVDYVLWHFV